MANLWKTFSTELFCRRSWWFHVGLLNDLHLARKSRPRSNSSRPAMPYVNQERLVLKFPTVWFHAHSWPGPYFQRPQRRGQCYTSGVSSWKPCALWGFTIRDHTSFAWHWILFCSGLLRLNVRPYAALSRGLPHLFQIDKLQEKCFVTSSFHQIKWKTLLHIDYTFIILLNLDLSGTYPVKSATHLYWQTN